MIRNCHATTSYASKWIYKDGAGRQEVETGFLPAGFLAIDIAHYLQLPLYDPDNEVDGPDGKKVYETVDPTIPQQQASVCGSIPRTAMGSSAAAMD